MNLRQAIDEYVVDQRSAGRINSPKTEVAYRSVLERHAVDVGNRDPRTIGREDCKRTLARWPHPNTQRCSRSILVSFYDWTMEEGHRKDNPARQTRRPKKRPTAVYRLSQSEALSMLDACETKFERRAIFVGLCAGLRNQELRWLQGLHFERDGVIWLSPDIAKGQRERWLPIMRELEPVVNDIRATVAPAHFVLPGQWVGGGSFGSGQIHREFPLRPCSSQHLARTVEAVAIRAGIAAHVHPHLLRHAFADYVTRHCGIEVAQELLGHADIRTTQGYTGKPTLDQLAEAVRGLSFDTPPSYPSGDEPDELERRGRDSNPRPSTAQPSKGSARTGGQR